MTAMLLHGATVVTVDRERRIIDDGAVLIDRGSSARSVTARRSSPSRIRPSAESTAGASW